MNKNNLSLIILVQKPEMHSLPSAVRPERRALSLSKGPKSKGSLRPCTFFHPSTAAPTEPTLRTNGGTCCFQHLMQLYP